MFFRDPWLHILDDDHGSTNAPSVNRNIDGSVVVIDVDADEFAETSSSSKATEIVHEAIGKSSQTDNCTIHIYDESIRSVNLSTCSLTYV